MKITSIVSARPNFVKLAAIVHALARTTANSQLPIAYFEHVIVHTGQHYDPLLSAVFFHELEIPGPDENLEVKSGKSNENTVERTRAAALPVLRRLKPDLVLVYGDVSGALGGARAAHELGIPIAHVEAGLRSFDNTMPEEYNRREIDKISTLLFATERAGVDNLRNENITKGIHLVGNTMIDTLQRSMPRISKLEQIVCGRLPKLRGSRFAVATIHRPGNVDTSAVLAGVIEFLKEVARECPIVLPAHPRLQRVLASTKFSIEDTGPPLHVTKPLDYPSFVAFMRASSFVITDSGGIQEETTFLKKKCFTLRKNTERPCTLEEHGGSNTLVDLERPEDRRKVIEYAQDPTPVHVSLPEKWDGKAGERILEVLRNFVHTALVR